MTAPRRISLALQGGGSHGAFTWGVLDRLLEEDGLEIAGISGSSAGALNGAALKAGMIAGGREGAKDSLDRLWSEVATLADLRVTAWMKPWMPMVAVMSDAVEETLPFSPAGLMSQIYTPYSMGSAWRNPLEDVVRRLDFSKVCASEGPVLFVAATNVRSGKIRVFEGQEISPEAILASACLPTAFQAVELTDPKTGVVEAYWDGGFTGNPALFPLFAPSLPDDLLIVSINPMRREEVPRSPLEIQNRINEISFNTSLLRELRAIAFVKRLIAEGKIPKGAMRDLSVHLIADDGLMTELTAASKLRPRPDLLARLKLAGRTAAETWLDGSDSRIGAQSGTDLVALFD